MKKWLFILFFPLIISAQTPEEQIDLLKNSSLLIRLKTRDQAVQAASDAGLTEMAEEMKEEQRLENEEIVKAFIANYDFCPIYFFYSSCSKDILDRNFKGCLLDANLQPVKSIPDLDDFFIAEFDYVKKQPDSYFGGYTVEYDTSGAIERRSNYYGGTELGPDALVMMDSRFRQLRQPFPFYVRTYQGFFLLRRDKAKVVEILNNELNEFYKQD